jgi:DNA-binding MarR family transcriptional regulator
MSNLQTHAIWLHSLGANVNAIKRGEKNTLNKWKHLQSERQANDELESYPWDRAGGVGIMNGPGGFHSFDIDALKDGHGRIVQVVSESTLLVLLDALGLPRDYRWTWRGQSKAGWGIEIHCDAPLPAGVLPAKRDEAGVSWGWPEKDGGADWHHLELRWTNCQTILPPSMGYQWRGETPTEPPTSVPIHRILSAFFALCPPQPHTLGSVDRAIIDQIRTRFDLVDYAVQQFGGDTQAEGDEVRVLGHSGLLINPEKGIWHCFGDEIGGDCFDLIAYAKYRTTARNLNGKSAQVLTEAADVAGIPIPTRRPATFTQSSPAVHPTPRLLPRHALGTITPTTWLIDGVLAMNKLSQTFAPPGSGKSFTELDKALCVAQRYPVVYIAAEAVEDYHERVSAWEAHHGTQAGQIYFWPEPIALKDPASVDAFLTEIHAIQPAAIFVDPLASCMVGLEESSTGDMTIAVEALNHIRRETGAAVHIVHHTGWSEAHERGSSVLRAACRIVMKLSMDDSGLMTLTCEKANNGKPFEARHFRLIASADSAVVVPANKVSMRDAPLSEKQFAIMETLDLMHFRDGATFSQIQEHTNMAKSTVNKAISRLMELGSISCEKSRSTTYRNTAKGNAELAARLSSTVAGVSSPVHPHSELAVNWMVNNLGTARPNAEFTQFTPNHEKTAPVHHASEQTSSQQFIDATASQCASSPQFTPSSPVVHPTEFTSSPVAPPLGGDGSEQNSSEQNDPYHVIDWLEEPPRYTVAEWQEDGDHDLPGEYATLEEARAAMPDPAWRVAQAIHKPNVNMKRPRLEEIEAAAMVRDEDND